MTSAETTARPGEGRSRVLMRLVGIGVGLAVFAVLAYSCWSHSYPPLASRLQLKIVFPKGITGTSEPIVSTGGFGAGDFLRVTYTDAETGVISYDHWGLGGPSSPPFALRPKSEHLLELVLPALAVSPDDVQQDHRPLSVVLDGRELLNASQPFYRCKPDQFYFAENPIGGSVETLFRGRLYQLGGQRLLGRPALYFSRAERVSVLWRNHALHLLVAAVVGLLAGFIVTRFAGADLGGRVRRLRDRDRRAAHRPHHLTFGIVAFACAIAFTSLLTGGTFKLLYEESFGAFYDYQAISLLHGRLDVPRAAIDDEAFIFRGKTYGYFGVTPAVLRVPFVAAHVAFGKLSRSFMLAYYVAALVATYLLLCLATTTLCGAGKWPSRWAIVLLTGGSGLGSTLFFLGSRSYIYHEAILCGAAFALWSVYCSLRYLDLPRSRWWVGALLCGLAAVHARPPAGLFSLFLLGGIALFHFTTAWRVPGRERLRGPAVCAVLAALAFLSFNGMSYLKFRTFDGAPFKYSVQYNAERLARFDGTNFHLVNFRHDFDAYILTPDFHLESRFPWFYFGARTHRAYPEAKLDLTEPTVAIPYAMPGLFALAIAGGAWALLTVPRLRRPVLFLVAGVGPMAFALFIATATSHRYTADFCPFFIALASYGLAVLDSETRRWRAGALGAVTILVVASAIITPLLALQYQGKLVWGAQPEMIERYHRLQTRFDDWFNVHHS